MSRHPYPSADALLADCAACAADQVIADARRPGLGCRGFARLLAAARAELAAMTASVVSAVARVLAEAHEAEAGLGRAASPAMAAAFARHARPAGRA